MLLLHFLTTHTRVLRMELTGTGLYPLQFLIARTQVSLSVMPSIGLYPLQFLIAHTPQKQKSPPKGVVLRMSTYTKTGKALEFDNAPDWLVAYMRQRRTLSGNTLNSVATEFIALREYFQWLSYYKTTGQSPKTEKLLREIDILDMTLQTATDAQRIDSETYLFFCRYTLNN